MFSRPAVAKLEGSGPVSVQEVDVTDADAVARAADTTVARPRRDRYSSVANAGIAGPNVKTWEYPVDDWKQVIDINLIGIFLCLPSGLSRKCSRRTTDAIVNVASIAGKEGNPNASAYQARRRPA